jgi:hypothetical protein
LQRVEPNKHFRESFPEEHLPEEHLPEEHLL